MISYGVSVSGYIIDSKFMVFVAQSQRHFKLIFDFSYTIVVECCEICINS